ncbi:hypothetical protein UY3_13655 [Chelonia mydas]|uniref:Uncharacterized protein n=1 Tax=Chelonia mydas TaxID=8469 RepID=M7BAQ1_CHEMY|nr:hypothetical protein UY3_13655 [Chelonia mydas]
MQAEAQQQSGGYPVYCTQCSMYDYLLCGWVAYVCIQCKELLALRDRIQALEVRVAQLEELREPERYVDEAFQGTVDLSHLRLLKVEKGPLDVQIARAHALKEVCVHVRTLVTTLLSPPHLLLQVLVLHILQDNAQGVDSAHNCRGDLSGLHACRGMA